MIIATPGMDEAIITELLGWYEENMAAFRLTPAECMVARELRRGYSNKEIASQIGISEQTVKNHMTVILGKLGVCCREQAILRLYGLPVGEE